MKQLIDYQLQGWLKEAVARHASDLFLSAGEPPTLKVFDTFQKLNEESITEEKIADIVEFILTPDKMDLFKNGQEVDMGLDLPGCSRFRMNIFKHQLGMAIMFRPIPYEIPYMSDLGLPPVFNDLIKLQRGLILITGPAGSGKSTTLASFLNKINQEQERHVITVEDPIEYLIPNNRSIIHQREVGAHTLSFEDGLKNALRENPNIIVVGELRDLESIELAVRAAETGHLVLGTLHSGTAIQAITRLLDVFDSERQPLIRVQLAQSLQAVCAQRLYKRLDGKGMILATEVLIGTLAVHNIIREHRLQELRGYMETGMREQMHTFRQSVQALVDMQMIDPSHLTQVVEESPVPQVDIPLTAV